MESDPVVGRPIGRQTLTRQGWTRNRSVARDVVLSSREATIGSKCPARISKPPRTATNSFPLESAVAAQLSRLDRHWVRVDSAGSGNKMKKCRPARRHISFRRAHDPRKAAIGTLNRSCADESAWSRKVGTGFRTRPCANEKRSMEEAGRELAFIAYLCARRSRFRAGRGRLAFHGRG